MKKLLLLCATLLLSHGGFAECAGSGIQFLPAAKKISLNSMFIIQAYAHSQNTVNTFKGRTVYLESSNGDIVILTLIETLKGQKELTQAVFRPVTALSPNTKYYLRYSDQTAHETDELKEFNRETGKHEAVAWETTDIPFYTAIPGDLKIVFQKADVKWYGCGPEANAIFTVGTIPETETWFRTELVNTTTKATVIFYLRSREGRLFVGHGMCSGGFSFEPKSKYKVRFTPLNTDGKAATTTQWSLFDSPFQDERRF